MKTSPENREKAIQTRILQYLWTNNIFCWRENSGVMYVRGHQYRMGYPGIADIMGILPNGRLLAVEVKTASGRQNPNQVEFQRQIEKNNGLYILARSTEDVSGVLNNIFTHSEAVEDLIPRYMTPESRAWIEASESTLRRKKAS